MTNDSANPGSPFRSRGFVAGAVVIALILVLGIIAAVVLAVTAQNDDDPDPTPTGTSSGPSAEDASVCGLEGFETENTLTTAPENEWELVGTVAAPTDSRVGPGVIDGDGFRSCYAHTAEGALYAVANWFAMGTDSRLAPLLVERFAAPGPGRDVALENQASEGVSGGDSNLRAQIAGFAINAYSADEATVDVAYRVSNTGALVSIPVIVVWVEGDWKLVLDESGSLPLKPASIASLGGYIPWSGA